MYMKKKLHNFLHMFPSTCVSYQGKGKININQVSIIYPQKNLLIRQEIA